MRGSEALRWKYKPVYNLERTLNNEGDDLWSGTKAKATDVWTTSLLAACLMCTLWDLKVFCGGKGFSRQIHLQSIADNILACS